MAQVRKRIAPPLVGSDIILVIRPGQNINQVLDCTYQELVSSLSTALASASGLVPETRTLTINGVTYDLTQDRSWTVGGGTGAVDSVNGQTGVVVLALDDISNVNAPSPTLGQILQWNGTQWVSATVGAAAWGSIGAGTGVGSQADLVAYLAANYQVIGSYVLTTRTITINGVNQDLSANRSWNLTANNGVQQTTGTPTNFELGGSIIKNTLINVGPANSAHDLQFDSPGPLDGSGKIKFTATTGTYSSTDKLVRFEASGAVSAYVIAAGTNGTGIFIDSTSANAVPMIMRNSSAAEILRMLNSGQLQLNLYNSGTAFQGSSGSSVGVLNVDNTGKLFVGAGASSGVFQHEIHVSQVDGNDTTGNGTLLNPVASITYALTLLTGSRKTIVVHPGTYSENVTVANTNTTIATTELTGANTLLSGTLTIGTAGSGSRISGLKMTNLVISGTAQAYISNCTVDTQVTKSSSGYVEIINTEMQCTLGIQISGSNITIINGNKNVGVAVSNASAQVIIKGCNSVVTPSASAGNLAIVDCIVTALGGNGITITNPSTTLTLLNSQVLVTAGNNVAPISVAGIYTIINTVYDKPTSTFTGISTNSIDYFQYINADKFIKQGGTASEFLMADGSVTTGGGGGGINQLTTDVTTPAASSGVTVATLAPNLKTGSFGVTVDGVTGIVQVGTIGYVVMPYAGTITGYSITANVAGTVSFDITRASGAIPTVSIIGVGGNYPTLTAPNQFITSTTMTNWILGFAAGDVFGFSVRASPAPASIKNATLTIRTTRT